ncbi:hypothetical protein Y032_0030g2217 [Ancylostoma ceylanicum]|uniref:Uncharacterized protein n=1 Tax=Ancylostoma ceylanicum TaxID=53326 RepID=A0A016UQL2_9BILA|nr:hypothetical protein Y032_0030g2217 [Ancylostoma ceylanicum]
MLSLYLFIFVAGSVSTARIYHGEKPPAKCDEPIKFFKNRRDALLNYINERRRVMVEGEQRNGPTDEYLPMGENVTEMDILSSTIVGQFILTSLSVSCPSVPSECLWNTSTRILSRI